jgi:hypothetical protein
VIDPIAFLPTPVAPRFRFMTGPKAKPGPRLDFVDVEEACDLSPPPMEFRQRQIVRTQESLHVATTSPAGSDGVEDVDSQLAGRQVELSFDSSLEFANAPITSSQLLHLDRTPPPSPSPSPAASTTRRRISRITRTVTFSSPIATPYLSQTLTPDHTPVRRRRMRRSKTLGRSPQSRTSPLRRTKTLPAGLSSRTTPTSAASVSRIGSLNGKIFRRMSLVPQFDIPSQDVVEGRREVEPSYVPAARRLSPVSLSPVNLSLPPPGQTTTAPRSSTEEEEEEEEEETFSFTEVMIDCLDQEDYDRDISEGVSMPYDLSPFVSTAKPLPCPSSPRQPLVRLSSDPNAILSLPSSFPRRHQAHQVSAIKRATTVGCGGVGRGGLGGAEWA